MSLLIVISQGCGVGPGADSSPHVQGDSRPDSENPSRYLDMTLGQWSFRTSENGITYDVVAKISDKDLQLAVICSYKKAVAVADVTVPIEIRRNEIRVSLSATKTSAFVKGHDCVAEILEGNYPYEVSESDLRLAFVPSSGSTPSSLPGEPLKFKRLPVPR